MDLDTRYQGSDADFGKFTESQGGPHDFGIPQETFHTNAKSVSDITELSANEQQRPLRIMVVEDTVASQKLFKRVLEPAGYQLHIAANGIEAIRDFVRVHPDLIIMDLQMPVLDGLQTTSILRALDKHHPTIPIIATSARHQPLDRERFFAVGVDAFIPKPFDNQEFLGLIRQVFHQKHEHEHEHDGESNLVTHAPDLTVYTMQNTLNGNVVNIATALNRLGGDKQLMGDLINFFFEDFPSLLEELRGAILRHDWNRVQRAAHSFKGLAANFDAAPAVQIMQALESQSVNHDPEQLSQLMADAEVEVARLTAALAEYQQSAEA
jgi:CheY-like chemotaxis protein